MEEKTIKQTADDLIAAYVYDVSHAGACEEYLDVTFNTYEKKFKAVFAEMDKIFEKDFSGGNVIFSYSEVYATFQKFVYIATEMSVEINKIVADYVDDRNSFLRGFVQARSEIEARLKGEMTGADIPFEPLEKPKNKKSC